MIETIFSMLTEKQLKHGVHTSVPELVGAIMEFVEAHNDNPKPFKWTKTADQILEKVARFCMDLMDRNDSTPESEVPET